MAAITCAISSSIYTSEEFGRFLPGPGIRRSIGRTGGRRAYARPPAGSRDTPAIWTPTSNDSRNPDPEQRIIEYSWEEAVGEDRPGSSPAESPVNDVAGLIGHEQISTTLNRYTHASRDRNGRARAVFADFSLNPILGKTTTTEPATDEKPTA